MVKLILAIGKNGLIGKGNRLPWKIPSELEHFKKVTNTHDMIMGSKTFLSLPGKLPNRKHLVLSSAGDVKGADQTISSFEEAKELFKQYKGDDKHIFIIGGKIVAEALYKEADELILSKIKEDVTGDVFINLDVSEYSEEKTESNEKFDVFTYRRKNA